MHIGFTGTQHGTSEKQQRILHELLQHFCNLSNSNTLHHGDCIGADAEVHALCLMLGIHTHIHPPTNPNKRAFCAGDFIEEECSYLERNHEIVQSSQFMIATPYDKEVLRSGTWATIRHAYKTGKYVYVIDRQGKIVLLPPKLKETLDFPSFST